MNKGMKEGVNSEPRATPRLCHSLLYPSAKWGILTERSFQALWPENASGAPGAGAPGQFCARWAAQTPDSKVMRKDS